MPIGSGNFGKTIDLGAVMRHYYGLTYNRWEEKYSKYHEVRTSAGAFEESLNFTGFTTFPEKTKGSAITYEDAKQNWVGRHINITYAKGFIVERELWDDARTNVLKQLPTMLARALTESVEILGAATINNATTATGPDGVALSATTHPLGGGGTFSNQGTAADLSETSFEQMQIDLAAWVDDAGLRIHASPKMLMVTPTFSYTASKLLGSDLTPEDANNSINPAKGLVPFMVNPYITDTDSWQVVTDCPNGLLFYWRDRPEFGEDNDFDTENRKIKGRFRCVASWDDPRGMYFNAGA